MKVNMPGFTSVPVESQRNVVIQMPADEGRLLLDQLEIALKRSPNSSCTSSTLVNLYQELNWTIRGIES